MADLWSTLPEWTPRPARPRRGLSPLGSRGPGSLYRRLRSVQLLLSRDRRAALGFLRARWPVDVPVSERLRLLARFVRTTDAIRCFHTQTEMLVVADAILSRAGVADLCVVEAGAGKGASTAKLSLATARAGGRLHVFDSFHGIPPNDEQLVRLDGGTVRFHAGAFAGRLPAVCRNVERWGALGVCEFHKGWFHETLPGFTGHVDVALLDVDLLSSTRACLVHLFPRLRPGGVLFTQDGHLRAVVDLVENERFWRDEVGVPPPLVRGLRRRKMLELRPAPIRE